MNELYATNVTAVGEMFVGTIAVTNTLVQSAVTAPASHTFCYAAMAGAFIVGAVFAWFWLTQGKWRLT